MDLDDQDWTLIKAYQALKLYSNEFGSNELWQMQAFEFMNTFKEFIEILNGDSRYYK